MAGRKLLNGARLPEKTSIEGAVSLVEKTVLTLQGHAQISDITIIIIIMMMIIIM